MDERAGQVPTGAELLELQFTVMRQAMTWMASGTRQWMQIGMAAAYGKPLPGLALPNATQLASANKDYALRVQEDVDSILHAFAMAPVAADRLIRSAAIGREGPARTTNDVRTRGPASPAVAKPVSGKRRGTRAAAEHAR